MQRTSAKSRFCLHYLLTDLLLHSSPVRAKEQLLWFAVCWMWEMSTHMGNGMWLQGLINLLINLPLHGHVRRINVQPTALAKSCSEITL